MEKITAGLRGILRFILFIFTVLTFLAVAFVIHFVTQDPTLRRRRFAANSNRFAKFAVRVFSIKTVVVNPPAPDEKFLLVSNHMGFIDIMTTCSVVPIIFITSQEMRETPLLGLMTEMGGCMYVERRSRSQILHELHAIADVLKQGFRVVLYPEATSTNGEQVLPFKRTLMMAAAYAEVPIQPIVVNFRKINGEPFSLKWRDHVCWYGDIGFLKALWRSFTLKTITVEIEFLEKIYSKVEDDRGVIADQAHDMIAAKFVTAKPVADVDSAETKELEPQT